MLEALMQRLFYVLALVALFLSPIEAQLKVQYTVLPSTVITEQVSNEHGLDQVLVWVLNQGPAPRVIPSFIYLVLSAPPSAPPIPFIDTPEAQQMLSAAISKSFWSRFGEYAGDAAGGVTAGAALFKASTKFVKMSAVTAVVIPFAEALATKYTPTATALFSNQASYPITLQPSGTYSDYEFCVVGSFPVQTGTVTATRHMKATAKRPAPTPVVYVIP
jgi:hypothetical protein